MPQPRVKVKRFTLNFFFHPQAHTPTIAKIKECKRHKRNTHARQIRLSGCSSNQNLPMVKFPPFQRAQITLQQMPQQVKTKGCLSEHILPEITPIRLQKTKDAETLLAYYMDLETLYT